MVSLSPYTYGLFFHFNGSDKNIVLTSDEVSSAAFDDFRANRLIVANRLAAERGIDVNNPSNIDADGYPLDLGKIIAVLPIPEVMRQGFLRDFRSVPIPNWAVKYNGLMRYDLFKRNFKIFFAT
jgi:cell surface protein SprA